MCVQKIRGLKLFKLFKVQPLDILGDGRNKLTRNDTTTTTITKSLDMDDKWVHDRDGNLAGFKESMLFSIRSDKVGEKDEEGNDKWETYMPTNDVSSLDI